MVMPAFAVRVPLQVTAPQLSAPVVTEVGVIAPSPSVSVLLASAAVIPLAVAMLLRMPVEALTKLVPVPAELSAVIP